jgi:hypothetical protein
MTPQARSVPLAFAPLLAAALAALFGCGSNDPAQAYVENDFPSSAPLTIVKVWYQGTTFNGPLLPGVTSTSATLEVQPGAGLAYVLGYFGPGPGSSSTQLVVETAAPIEAVAGRTIPVVISLPSHRGVCSNNPINQVEYDRVHSSYFPSDPVMSFATAKAGCGGP